MKDYKILITGGNGFIARSLKPLFESAGYKVYSPSRAELDVSSLDSLNKYFNANGHIDVVVHAALSGEGRLLKEDPAECLYKNILMQENLLHLYYKCKFRRLVVFSSGAQENRNKDILNLSEEQYGEPPESVYSLAKYINSKLIWRWPNALNLRIFNVFGPLEKDSRFIKTAIKNYTNNKPIEIWGDKYFDFFYYEDLFKVIDNYIHSFTVDYKEYNAVYKEKLKLSEIATIINQLDKNKVDIIIKDGINKHYTGNSSRLDWLKIDFVGLREGLRRTYEVLKNERI